MTDPTFPSLLSAPPALLSGAVPAATVLLIAAFANAVNARPLQGRCQTHLSVPPHQATAATYAIITAQCVGGLLLLVAPSSGLAAFCLAAFLLSRGLAARHCGVTSLPRLHLGLTGLLPAPVAVFLDTLLTLSLLGTGVSAWGEPAFIPLFSPGTVAVGLGATFLAASALLLTRRSLSAGPLLRPRPLRVGRRWPAALAGPLPARGPVVVLLMSSDCPACLSWLRLLRARAAMGYFYPLHIVTPATPPEELRSGTASAEETHATLTLHQLLALSETLPCAVLIHDGAVVARWTDGLPPDWMTVLSPAPPSPPLLRTIAGHNRAGGRAGRTTAAKPAAKPAESHRYFSPGPV